MKRFVSALQFLTTIRLVDEEPCTNEQFAGSMIYFPLIGLIIGGVLALVAYAASLRLPAGLVAAILLAAEIMLTGGLHLDGYMDTMDGLFSGRSRERILEIMKDSRVGSHAVIALMGLFFLKYALFQQVVQIKGWPVLVLMPALGRMGMGLGAALFPYARPEGMGKGFAEYFTRQRLLITVVYCGVAAWGLLRLQGIVLSLAIIVWAWIFSRFVQGRIGGLTGDVYGALSELSEVVVLLVAVFLVK